MIMLHTLRLPPARHAARRRRRYHYMMAAGASYGGVLRRGRRPAPRRVGDAILCFDIDTRGLMGLAAFDSAPPPRRQRPAPARSTSNRKNI